MRLTHPGLAWPEKFGAGWGGNVQSTPTQYWMLRALLWAVKDTAREKPLKKALQKSLELGPWGWGVHTSQTVQDRQVGQPWGREAVCALGPWVSVCSSYSAVLGQTITPPVTCVFPRRQGPWRATWGGKVGAASLCRDNLPCIAALCI